MGGSSATDGRVKSLIMFSQQTNSPASRFLMSPQDNTTPYYRTKSSQVTMAVPLQRPSALHQSADPEESFILPAIEDYLPMSPTDEAAGHTSMLGDGSVDLRPPSTETMHLEPGRKGRSPSEASDNA